MKTLLYTFILSLVLLSCTSVQKMLDKGEYDKAFTFAIAKLQGNSKKKTEHVKALEIAFAKWEASTLRQINGLRTKDKPENWKRALELYSSLISRQERILLLLPLISKDGYEAIFKIKNYNLVILEAEQMTCDYFYNHANILLKLAEENNNKLYARQAYDELVEISKFKNDYKDIKNLMDKAIALGTMRVYVDIIDRVNTIHSEELEKMLWQMPISSIDNFWTDYSIGGFDKGNNADFTVVVSLENLDFSAERESSNRYSEEKDVLIRKDVIKEKRDTTWIEIEKEIWQRVRADITEVHREKIGTLSGFIKLYDNKDKEYISNIPINILDNFNGYACKYVGNEKALSQESKKKIDNYLELWPSDASMMLNISNSFQNVILKEAKKLHS